LLSVQRSDCNIYIHIIEPVRCGYHFPRLVLIFMFCQVCKFCHKNIEIAVYVSFHCITPLFYVLAPTCFGSSLPSSGSLLGPPELVTVLKEKCVCLKVVAHQYLFLCCLVFQKTESHPYALHSEQRKWTVLQV
jgi:hypothetical protein